MKTLNLNIFLFILLLLGNYGIMAQTGPGGVGNTTGSSNLRVWLAADMGTSTTTTGQRVSSWTDQSGYGNAVANPTAGTGQPIYRTGGANGQPYLNFAGGQFLQIANQASLNSNSSTVFVVAEGALSGTAVAMASSGFNQEMLVRDESIFHHISSGNFRNRTHQCVASIPNSEARILTAGFGTAATSLDLYINGLLSTDNLSGSTGTSYTTTNRNLRIGRRSNGEYLTGNVYEVIVYSGVLNTTDRKAVEEYLRCKYDIDYTVSCSENPFGTSVTNVDCNGANTGAITLTGGSAGYTYDIGSGSQMSSTFAGLSAGNYTITVNDTSASCSIEVGATVTEPSLLAISLTAGSSFVNTTVSGGTTPYSYLWSDGQTTASATGLMSNTLYGITVTDNNNCVVSDTITLMAGNGPGGIGNTNGNSILKVWLAADMGTSTTTTGQRVSSWTDQSGYGNAVANPTAGTGQPIYRTGGANGQPYLNFAGGQFLQIANQASLNSNSSTVFVVADGALSGTAVAMASSGFNQEMLVRDESIFHHISSGNFRNRTHQCVAGISNSEARILTAGFGTAATSLDLYINGLLSTDNLSGSTGASYTTTNRNLRVGRRSNGEYLRGNIYEVIVYSGVLNTTEREAVEEYLRCKYDITNNGCGSLSTASCFTSVSTLETATRINIYPNPANQYVKIELNNESIGSSVQVLNAMGQIVMSPSILNSTQEELDIQHLPSGIYFVQLVNAQQIITTQKFIKN